MTDLKKDLKLNKKGPIKINIGLKQIVIAIVALFFISSILISAGEIATTTNEKPISKIISDIKARKVKKIEIVGNKVLVHYSKDRIVTTSKEEGESFVKTLTDAKIDPTSLEIRVKSTDTGSIIVNFLANVMALKNEGCTHILAATAVGSLREEIKPGNLVFPNQFIDFTRHRNLTYFTDCVVHTPMAEPYDKNLRDMLCQTSEELGFTYNRDVTVVTIEGPRFSTYAESHMFRNWGADIINMSTCPEVILANELGLPYQTIAMSTDYDCWKENEAPVTFEMVLETMKANAEKVKQLLIKVIPKI